MDITVDTDEVLAAYRQQLSEASHQMIIMKVAYDKLKDKWEKAEARIREFGAALEAGTAQADQEDSPERPRNPQRARQLAPGLNGAQKDGEAD